MEHAVYKDFPAPAARDESHPQANGHECPSLTASVLDSQFGVSTGADYGHIPSSNGLGRHPHPVDFVVDDT